MDLWDELQNAGQKIWDEGFRDPAENTLHAMTLDTFNKPKKPRGKMTKASDPRSGELIAEPADGQGLTPIPIEGGYTDDEMLAQQKLLADALKQYPT